MKYIGPLIFGLLVFAIISVVMPFHRSLHTEAPQAGVSQQAVLQEQIATKQRDLDARVQALMFKYDCTIPGAWKQDHPLRWDLPKTMVLKQDHTFTLSLKPWTMPAPAHQWVLLLCSAG